MAKQTNNQEQRDARIKASSELWACFDAWARLQGCVSLPDGIRTAMREVTNFKMNCQGKNSINSSDSAPVAPEAAGAI